MSKWSCIFFFQAEDGIRDHCVTGVQTCALPISAGWYRVCLPDASGKLCPLEWCAVGWEHWKTLLRRAEIGRASCREKCRSRGSGCSLKEREWVGVDSERRTGSEQGVSA